MCDWRSTTPQDYTASDHKTPVWEGESLQVYHNPAHQWWFAKEMKEDDVLLIKMYDSEAEKSNGDIAMCEWMINNPLDLSQVNASRHTPLFFRLE